MPMQEGKNVLEVSGFSEKMLEIVSKIWKDDNALIKEIESIEL
jgi:hypothetical protein